MNRTAQAWLSFVALLGSYGIFGLMLFWCASAYFDWPQLRSSPQEYADSSWLAVFLSFGVAAYLTAYVSKQQSAELDRSIKQMMGRSSIARTGVVTMVLLLVTGILYGMFVGLFPTAQ